MNEPNADHPKQDLLFIVLDGNTPRLAEAFRRLVSEMQAARRWVLGPPEVVELEGEENDVAGLLRLYSSLPPWGERLPKHIDAAHLEEVTFLVERLAQLSKDFDVEVELELDGDSVGDIQKGQLSRTLAEGLLGEWRRRREQ
jgi:hypothetical protein